MSTLQTRDMPLKEFQEKYPEDFKSGALKEIRARYAAMAEEAQQRVPSTTMAKSRKRAVEPATVLRTVRARRGALLGPSAAEILDGGASETIHENDQLNAGVSTRSEFSRRKRHAQEAEKEEKPSEAITTGEVGLDSVPELYQPKKFNSLPLQTPLPFSGAAMPLPVTMVTQKKRGGRTKAAPAPDAIIVATADGKQWALGKEGVEGIPETHRSEVADMLQQQFQFLSAALGKTVTDRSMTRGGKR